MKKRKKMKENKNSTKIVIKKKESFFFFFLGRERVFFLFSWPLSFLCFLIAFLDESVLFFSYFLVFFNKFPPQAPVHCSTCTLTENRWSNSPSTPAIVPLLFRFSENRAYKLKIVRKVKEEASHLYIVLTTLYLKQQIVEMLFAVSRLVSLALLTLSLKGGLLYNSEKKEIFY